MKSTGRTQQSGFKPPARGFSTSMPTPGQTAETTTTTGQIAEEVTKTVLNYLQKHRLVAKTTNETDKVRETHVQQTQQTDHTNTNMNLETINLNQGSSITSTPLTCRQDKTRFTSSRVPLHATVNLKKKVKIWANEFIELSTLQEDEVEDISFSIHTGAVSSNTSKRSSLLSSSGPMHLIYMLRSAHLNIRRKPKDWLHTWGSSAALCRNEGAGTFTILTFVVSANYKLCLR